MVAVKAIHSIALTVAELDRTQSFYIQALGFKPVGDITIEAANYSQIADVPPRPVRIVTLQLGDETIELVDCLDSDSAPIPRDSQSNDLWFQHMAIVVSDLDRAYKHLQSFSVEPISDGPQTIPANNPTAGGVRAFKFRDVDYRSLELIWFPEGKGKEKWHQNSDDLFLGIDHSAIAISNADISRQFYRDLLGMTVVSSTLHSGEVQATLDGLPIADVQVIPLQPAQTSIGIELLDYIKPGTGRPIPEHWDASDLAHMHIILETEEIESALEQLKQADVEIVSPHWVNFPDTYRFRRGCLIKDPDGHALLLVGCR
ncbi:hypothetical protein C1752_02399 [Acaryochloris thomasi RCC1774]|uniref:VOC domain-containing protein n=1 Tax=Acaryochloris thomasi RCC1774 TaxID=1764569 RepID=A0A2W1JIA6_9CYAN|nr:VOC family protein [Acaryochloris thomasi]PZD73240.1 hypothetical protein C1752_02399 [Acaryochloris thomasi RCC1774]